MSEVMKNLSHNAKYYEAKIKSDPEFYAKEKKRVTEYMRNRYATDEEYREKMKTYKREAYHKRKALNASNTAIIAN